MTYTTKLSDDSSLPSWLNFNSSQRKFSGIPTILTKYSIKVIANDSYDGSVSNNFDIIVENNNAPIVGNPIQNQIAVINTLFNYIFPNNTFIDPDGHSLTYTAKSSNNESLPNWLNFNSLQRKFSGTPNIFTTYSIKVIANDSYDGSVSTMFDLIVKDSLPTNTDLTTTLIIIGSITGVICAASFCSTLIIACGIEMLRQPRNKILRNESNTSAKEQHKQEVWQKPESTIPSKDTPIVVENELSPHVVQQEKSEVLEYDLASSGPKVSTAKYKEDVELDALPYKASMVPEYKGNVELDPFPYFFTED